MPHLAGKGFSIMFVQVTIYILLELVVMFLCLQSLFLTFCTVFFPSIQKGDLYFKTVLKWVLRFVKEFFPAQIIIDL